MSGIISRVPGARLGLFFRQFIFQPQASFGSGSDSFKESSFETGVGGPSGSSTLSPKPRASPASMPEPDESILETRAFIYRNRGNRRRFHARLGNVDESLGGDAPARMVSRCRACVRARGSVGGSSQACSRECSGKMGTREGEVAESRRGGGACALRVGGGLGGCGQARSRQGEGKAGTPVVRRRLRSREMRWLCVSVT